MNRFTQIVRRNQAGAPDHSEFRASKKQNPDRRDRSGRERIKHRSACVFAILDHARLRNGILARTVRHEGRRRIHRQLIYTRRILVLMVEHLIEGDLLSRVR